jgi:putative transposase
MIPLFILSCLSAFFRSRYNLALEILALRQQLGVLKRRRPHPRLRIQDRIFWTLLRRLWPEWSHVLVIVKPETVVAWHRAGFRLFWRLRSKLKTLAGQSSMPRFEPSSSGW